VPQSKCRRTFAQASGRIAAPGVRSATATFRVCSEELALRPVLTRGWSELTEGATHGAGLVVARVAGGGHRGCFGGLAEVTQEACDAAGLGDESNELHSAGALRAGLDLDGEGSLEELGPGAISRAMGGSAWLGSVLCAAVEDGFATAALPEFVRREFESYLDCGLRA
jgi:hypothetical protein